MKINIDKMTFQDILLIEPHFSDNFDKFWSVDILKTDFQNTDSEYIVARINSEIVGFAGIKIILDTADIMNIAVKNNKRCLGIGSLLLSNLIDVAKQNSCNSIMLEVNENNIAAIRLYEKFDFERISFRKKYYNNTYDAIIMKKILGGTNEK